MTDLSDIISPAGVATKDGDVLDVSFTPAGYTPDPSAPEALDEDDLAAHLKGIDAAISALQAVPAVPAGARTFLTSATVANDAAIDFTMFDGATYDAYEFVVSNLRSTQGATLEVRVSDDAGASFKTSVDYHSTATGFADSAFTASNNIGRTDFGPRGLSGNLFLYAPHLVALTFLRFDGVSWIENGNLAAEQSAGVRAVEEAINGIRFAPGLGNLWDGKISMYGIRNA